MTTATDWQPATWTDTGEHAIVTDVDVTSAATPDAPVRVGGWTPNPNHYIPEHVAALLAPTARNTPARSWARMSGARSWPQIPDEALTAYGRAEQEYRDAHQQIQDLRDLAFWVEQQQRNAVSRISERYTDRREALLSAYQAEHDRLVAGLDHTPYPAYMAALPAFVRGETPTVAGERHTSVYAELAPDRIADDTPTTTHSSSPDAATTPGPRPEVEAMARRDKERRQREQRATTTAQAETETAVHAPTQSATERAPWWRRHSETLIGVGVAVLWGAAMAALVVLA